jgi:hypothetical protein
MNSHFRIHGSDGKEYPGLTEELLKTWFQQGRVDADTPVSPEAEEAWAPLQTRFAWVVAAPPACPPATAVRCTHHPDRPAAGICSRCAEPCCQECLGGRQPAPVCTACQSAALASRVDAQEVEQVQKQARDSLTYGLLSIFFFGFITGVIAVRKGLKARERAGRLGYPVPGLGKATAGIWIGGILFLLNVLGILARIAKL